MQLAGALDNRRDEITGKAVALYQQLGATGGVCLSSTVPELFGFTQYQHMKVEQIACPSPTSELYSCV